MTLDARADNEDSLSLFLVVVDVLKVLVGLAIDFGVVMVDELDVVALLVEAVFFVVFVVLRATRISDRFFGGGNLESQNGLASGIEANGAKGSIEYVTADSIFSIGMESQTQQEPCRGLHTGLVTDGLSIQEINNAVSIPEALLWI